MEVLMKFFLYLHIGSGILALVVAPLAMVVRKGGDRHKRWGRLYFWSMTVVVATALIISIYKFIPFLLMIAVFSYYSVLSGYRAIYHKQLHLGKGTTKLDWVALVINGVFNLCFIIWGGYQAIGGFQGFFAYLAIGFGLAGLNASYGNLKSFVSAPKDKNQWLYSHISGMMAGYIATLTAFSATVLNFIPDLVAWLWPTVIGSLFIGYWIRHYRKLLSQGKKPKEVLILDS